MRFHFLFPCHQQAVPVVRLCFPLRDVRTLLAHTRQNEASVTDHAKTGGAVTLASSFCCSLSSSPTRRSLSAFRLSISFALSVSSARSLSNLFSSSSTPVSRASSIFCVLHRELVIGDGPSMWVKQDHSARSLSRSDHLLSIKPPDLSISGFGLPFAQCGLFG